MYKCNHRQPNLATHHLEVTSGEFLIPDLCAPRAVFVMVLLAELMVVVYALASSSLPRFN